MAGDPSRQLLSLHRRARSPHPLSLHPDDDEVRVIEEVLDGMLLKHKARRYAASRACGYRMTKTSAARTTKIPITTHCHARIGTFLASGPYCIDAFSSVPPSAL